MRVIEAMERFLDTGSLLLVGGGTIVAAVFRSTFEDIGRAVRSIGPLVRGRPAADEQAARRALRQIETIAELKGIACADRVDAASPFVRRAALKLIDAPSADAFARWAREEMEERAARHDSAIGVWRAAADAAPAMGMIGTVTGLIGMFATMDDMSRIGPFMAMAMLTTFYGLILSAVVAGPVAARLQRLSEAELRWQGQALARLEALARGQAAGKDWMNRRLKSDA